MVGRGSEESGGILELEDDLLAHLEEREPPRVHELRVDACEGLRDGKHAAKRQEASGILFTCG